MTRCAGQAAVLLQGDAQDSVCVGHSGAIVDCVLGQTDSAVEVAAIGLAPEQAVSVRLARLAIALDDDGVLGADYADVFARDAWHVDVDAEAVLVLDDVRVEEVLLLVVVNLAFGHLDGAGAGAGAAPALRNNGHVGRVGETLEGVLRAVSGVKHERGKGRHIGAET